MSLVVISKKSSNKEQFGKFITELNNLIGSHNANIDAGEVKSTQSGKIDLSVFSSKANELLNADNLSGLLSHILSIANILINDAKSSYILFTFIIFSLDAVSVFYILSLLASKIEDSAQKLRSVNELVSTIISTTTESSSSKFKLLVILFNSFNDDGLIRYEIFYSILKLADELNKPSILLTHLNTIDEYISAWQLSKDQQIKLLSLALRLINKTDDKL